MVLTKGQNKIHLEFLGMAAEASALMGTRQRRNVWPAVVLALVAACFVVGFVAIARNGGVRTLLLLNPGLHSGEDKDPDDPWGYATPTCRGLPTCSDSTSSPAIKRHQMALARSTQPKAAHSTLPVPRHVKSQSLTGGHGPNGGGGNGGDGGPGKDGDEGESAARAQHKGLNLKQQYTRILEQQGYFAPWSRQNSWNNRVAIANIRMNNTPQALARKEAEIKAENLKFHKAFDTPHTSQYTGKHETLAAILDPKYQPWANVGPRKAYYAGF